MNRRKLRFGDPYGNRTRVSAVKPRSPLESTSGALLALRTASYETNGLRGRGHGNGPSPLLAEIDRLNQQVLG